MSRRFKMAMAVACVLITGGISAAGVRANEDAPSHWLGIAGEPAESDVLKKLDIKNGLVVELVVPNSPAANAGIRVGDVLAKFGESDVKEVYQLQRVVNEHKDKTVALKLFRDGKPQTVKVTIAKRPQEIQLIVPVEKPEPKKESAETPDDRFNALLDKVRAAEERANAAEAKIRAREESKKTQKSAEEQLNEARDSLRKAIETRVADEKPVPKNLRIAIAKVGDQPAQATIERDGQKWEVTEESLDKLPQELQAHVYELFHKMAAGETQHNVKQNRVLTIPGTGQRIEIQIEAGDAKPRIHVERIEQTERREGGKAAPAEMRVIKVESPEHRNLEKRLEEIERKLDTVLKRLDDSAKPAKTPKKKKKGD